MPFPTKFTTSQILKLYEEFSEQDKDLKAFLEGKGLGEHYHAIQKRFQRLERSRARGEPVRTRTPSPKTIVNATIEEAVAAEAREQTEQLLILGKAVRAAYFKYAARRGLDIEEIKKTPIHEVILAALEKEGKYDALVAQNIELEDALRFYAQEVNPLFRLKSAISLLNEFLQSVTLAELVGFDFEGSQLIRHYQRLMELYLQGAKMD